MKFEGIMPALVTPLNADETINKDTLVKLIGFLIGQGADGFYIAGATGEGLNLRPDQRKVLVDECIRIVNHKKPCIVQVASTDFSTAVELAKHAEMCGAEAISATPPIFFSYDEDDVYNYYKELAGSVHIPMMIYNSPLAGFPINAKFAARLFEIDNVTAIKWTSQNYFQLMELKTITHGDMNIINGPDEMLLEGLIAGADGGIGTTYNFMLPTIKKIYGNFKNGNIKEAQRAQAQSAHVIEAMRPYALIPAVKAIMEQMGFAVGHATFPMKKLDEATVISLMKDINRAGFRY